MSVHDAPERRKVLVSAYACEPGRGSEPGVGWNMVKQIARFHEVWVITRANNRETIEPALQQEPAPNAHWVYFDLPRWARFWKKGQRGVRVYYCLWQIGAYLLARRLHKQIGFDLAHHVTFGNYWLPDFMALLPVPFIWGPVGGGESAPKAFYKTFGRRGRLYEYIRDLARWLVQRDPLTRLVGRRAAVALATTEETAGRLRNLGAGRVEVFSAVALPDREVSTLRLLPARCDNPFRLVSIGRLLHWKGCYLGLMAFARFNVRFPDSEYWFIGDGPERAQLEQLARELGAADKVRFWGRLPRAEVLDLLAGCDVLVHPSLHDSGGWVCAEAMAAGRPVICLDLGGPALQVTDDTGIKVPAIAPEQTVGDLAAAMLRLAQNPDLRAAMSKAGRERVDEHYRWAAKGRQIARVYEEVIVK